MTDKIEIALKRLANGDKEKAKAILHLYGFDSWGSVTDAKEDKKTFLLESLENALTSKNRIKPDLKIEENLKPSADFVKDHSGKYTITRHKDASKRTVGNISFGIKGWKPRI